VGEESGKSALVVVVALIGAPVFVIILLVVLLAGGGATPPPCGSAGGSSPGVGALSVGGIPADYVVLIQKAGLVSSEFPAPVIAAQLEQESGFHDALSSTGAQGPAQFEPATWATWGKDTTGKGFADVHNPSDAIDAQARFDAALAGQVKAAVAAGQIRSSASVTEMALGGYNAGIGAVLAAGGIPANSQTQAYVPRIMGLARGKFSQAGTVTAPGGTAPPGAGAGGGGTGTQASGCGNAGQIDVRQVAYPVPGGGTQPGDIYLPAGAGPGTTGRPVIVMIHGGGFYFGNRSELADAARGAATHGYIVFNADYDLSVPHWPRELDQTRAAVDFVRTQAATYGIDRTRIALLGDSAGGTLVAEAGLTGNHSGVQAVVSWSGAMNFETLPAQALAVGDSYQQAASVADPAIYLGCLQVLCPQLYQQASPALAITAGAPPTLLVNSATELVPTSQMTEMDAALKARGVVSQTLLLPGTRHANAYTADAIGPSMSFLDSTLHFTPPPPPTGGGSGGGGPRAQVVVDAAKTQLGVPYVWGGGNFNGPSGGGFDCSGLTSWAFHKVGVDLPRTADTQYAATAGTRLPGGFNPASYQPGDLIFYGTDTNIHHVAIAIGGGQLIQASTFGEPLNIKAIYRGDFYAATRPLGASIPASGGAPQ